MDIGCGTCTSIISLIKLLNDSNISYDIYGCDINPNILNEGIYNLNKTNVKCNLLICNGENLPYKDNYFDLVINYGGINQFENIYKGLLEMKRVVNKEGLCICRDEYYNESILSDFEKKYFNFIKNETIPIKELKNMNARNINISYLNKIQFLISFQSN